MIEEKEEFKNITEEVEKKTNNQVPQRFVAVNEEVRQYKCRLGKACKS